MLTFEGTPTNGIKLAEEAFQRELLLVVQLFDVSKSEQGINI